MLGFVSVRYFRWRMGLTPALVVALTMSVSGQANRANQAQVRWYDAYREGVAAVQKRDWATAEKRLLEARTSGPRPARRVLMYGDSYTAFLPDYYLGVVYLNTNRAQQAEEAFQQVRDQKVIAAKDPEYPAFDRQGREATFNRSFEEARQLVAKGDFTQASNLLSQARATRVDDGKVTALSREIEQQTAVAQKAAGQTAQVPAGVGASPPATTNQAQTPPPPPPIGLPSTDQTKASGTIAGSIPNTYKAPVVPSPIQAPRGTETFREQGVIVPSLPRSSAALQRGLLAFFSGAYSDAIPLLQSASQQPDVAQRARVFLACAKAGLVLTGGADAAMLREARADVEGADVMRSLTAAERRFISPKVLEQLERR